jgi:predicted amidohydrolase YtcJ
MRTLFHDGTVYTAANHEAVTGLLVEDGRVVAAGALGPADVSADAYVHLEGQTVMPGLIDAHHHLMAGALLRFGFSLAGARDFAEMLARIDEAVRASEGGWVVGLELDERKLAEKRMPRREELDRVTGDVPLLLFQFSFHRAVVNTAGLRGLGLPEVGGDAGVHAYGTHHRKRNGDLLEGSAARALTVALRWSLHERRDEMTRALHAYAAELSAMGITRLADPAVDSVTIDWYRELARAGELPLPVLTMLSSDQGFMDSPMHHVGSAKTGDTVGGLTVGPLKFFMDGGIPGAIRLRMSWGDIAEMGWMRLRNVFRGEIPKLLPAGFDAQQIRYMRYGLNGVRLGVAPFSKEELGEHIRRANDAGFNVAVHCIGSDAIGDTLEAMPSSPAGLPPNRIEHFLLALPDHVETAARKNVTVAVQPSFFTLGEEAFAGIPPSIPILHLRSFLEAGLTVAGSSDGPMIPPPLAGMQAAVTRRTEGGRVIGPEDERLTVRQSLALYTEHAARACGWTDAGKLEPGFTADFVVVDHDPVAQESWDAIHVAATYRSGEQV